MKGASEVKVGVVVVLALIVLCGGYFFLRGFGFGADAYYVRLNGAANIAAGNDVRLQGVKIGQIKEVTLDPATQKPLLTLSVKSNNPPFSLAKNYTYTVRSGSLIGENYVDIRGPYDPNAPLYVANDTSQVIEGNAVTQLVDVTAQISEQVTTLGKDFRATLQNLNVTLDRVNKGVLNYDNQIKLAKALDGVTRLTTRASQGFGPQGVKISLGDEQARRSLNNTLANTATAAGEASAAARNMNALTRDLGGVVQENRGQIRGLLTNLSNAANNAAGLTESLNFVVRDGGLKENSALAFRSFRRAAENMEATTASFKNLSNDPQTQKDLRDTLAALRITTESLRDTAVTVRNAIGDPNNQEQLRTTIGVLSETAGSLRTTMANLAEVSGGLKNTIGDPALQANLKASAENLAGTLAATRSAAERVNGLLGGRRPRSTADIGAANGGTSPAGTSVGDKAEDVAKERTLISTIPTGVDFTYRRFTSQGVSPRNFGDLTFKAELFGAPFRAGIANIGDGTDLTLQSGRFLGENAAVRYGLYRSKLGVGAELQKGRFSLEGNFWDPNRRSVNAYAGYSITPQLEILAGREHVAGVRTNSVGVRLRP
jgi:phospholipid/cholesterol/gamma-HCH transport system substrate-binding protein